MYSDAFQSALFSRFDARCSEKKEIIIFWALAGSVGTGVKINSKKTTKAHSKALKYATLEAWNENFPNEKLEFFDAH